jgi:hypothetical protein
MNLAPTNDDQWFWVQAVLNNRKIQVVKKPLITANYIEGTQQYGLFNINDCGKKLFWKDFNRLINYYPQLKSIFIKESNKYQYLKQIFSIRKSIKNNKCHKIITICAFKISFRNKKKELQIQKKQK